MVAKQTASESNAEAIEVDNFETEATTGELRPRTGLRYNVARSVDEVIEAWRLVHHSYVKRGLIDPNPEKLHTVPEVIGPHAAVAVGRIGPVAVSTLTSFIDQDHGLALDHVYPQELEAIRSAGRRLCEIGLFADRRQQFYRNVASLFDLMRFGVLYAWHQQVDDIVIGVHPRHMPFYRRLIGFQPAGPERKYATVNDNAVVLLRLDLHEAPSRQPMPRGLRYFWEHPVADEEFERRARLTPDVITKTPLEAFMQSPPKPGTGEAA